VPTDRRLASVGTVCAIVLAGCSTTGSHTAPPTIPSSAISAPAAARTVPDSSATTNGPGVQSSTRPTMTIALPDGPLLGLPRSHEADATFAKVEAATSSGPVAFQRGFWNANTAAGALTVEAGVIRPGREISLAAYLVGVRLSEKGLATSDLQFAVSDAGPQGGMMECATFIYARLHVPSAQCVWKDEATLGDVLILGRADAAPVTRAVRKVVETPH